MADSPNLTEYLDNLPSPDAIRAKLTENIRERALLRKLLDLAERKGRIKAACDEIERTEAQRHEVIYQDICQTGRQLAKDLAAREGQS